MSQPPFKYSNFDFVVQMFFLKECDNYEMEMLKTCSFFLAKNLNLEKFEFGAFFCYPLIGLKVNVKLG